MSFKNILEKYWKYSFSERDKGARFERLMQAYLQTDPQYANKFKNIWLWNEFFAKGDLGGNDTGIDLTTGVTLSGDDESAFVKVHDNDFLKAKKCLYMTATPRLYDDNSKSKAAQAEKEFSAIYVFNLRGNCRTQGELRRKEAGNVFGPGSRTPIARTILAKKGGEQ
jgi:predicted helicase